MNDLLPDPVTVQAPEGALEWSPLRGFIADLDELTEVHGEGELTLIVEAGIVAGVEGDAPLAVAIRQDRQLLELYRAGQTLALRLLHLEERLDVSGIQ